MGYDLRTFYRMEGISAFVESLIFPYVIGVEAFCVSRFVEVSRSKSSTSLLLIFSLAS